MLGLDRKAIPVDRPTSSQKASSKPIGALRAGSDRRASLRQNVETRQRILDARDAVVNLAAEDVEGLAHGHRHRVHQVSAADLDDIGECDRLAGEFGVQFRQSRKQPVTQFQRCRKMHDGRKAVIRRLRAIDVVVRVNRRLGSKRLSEDFVGPVGDHFVDVHVGLGAGTGLPDRQREMIVEQALANLRRRRLDRLGECCVEHAKPPIGADRGNLLQTEGVNEAGRKMLLADIEDAECTLGLRAPIAIGGYFDGAKGVVLDAECKRHGA